jgi:hypothetical protein
MPNTVLGNFPREEIPIFLKYTSVLMLDGGTMMLTSSHARRFLL